MPAASVQRTVAALALALMLCLFAGGSGVSAQDGAQDKVCAASNDTSSSTDECPADAQPNDVETDSVETDSVQTPDRSISTLRGPNTIATTATEVPPALGFGVSPQFSAPLAAPDEPVQAAPISDPAPLAKSGSESHGLIIIGMGLISAGAAVVAVTRRFTPDR